MSDIQNKDGKNGIKSLTVKQRIEFIDLAKGACILLVICEHIDVFVDYPGLQPIRMFLFFVLSGLLFKDYDPLMHQTHPLVYRPKRFDTHLWHTLMGNSQNSSVTYNPDL